MLGGKYASAGLKNAGSLLQVTRSDEHIQNHSVFIGPFLLGMLSYQIYDCIVMLNKTIQQTGQFCFNEKPFAWRPNNYPIPQCWRILASKAVH